LYYPPLQRGAGGFGCFSPSGVKNHPKTHVLKFSLMYYSKFIFDPIAIFYPKN
jgi:hypothetical protein